MKFVRALAVIPFLVACDVGCNLVGCFNGLTIEVLNAPPGPLTVQAIANGGPSSSVYTSSCPGTVNCTNTVYFQDFLPRNVRLTITTSAGTRDVSVSPRYSTVYPNGKRCGGACQSAREVVTW
jgi:hypothetical protein